MRKMIAQNKPAQRMGRIRETVRRLTYAIEDRKWDRSFARSQDVLKRLGDAALADYHAGRTEPLDPDKL